MIHKILALALISGGLSLPVLAQTSQKADTIIVNLATASRITLTIQDRKDIDLLKRFDFQTLFNDILKNIKSNDSTSARLDTTIYSPGEEEDGWKFEKNSETTRLSYKRMWKKHWQTFNVDLGTNNYLSDGKFPDDNNAPYSVRPWGSWYVAFNSVHRARLANKFFLEWGLGISWYNFKFQNNDILLERNDTGLLFYSDSLHTNFVKSKITASYLNASFIPVIDFGGKGKKAPNREYHSFRLGLGPYVGYRIGSYSKLVYESGKHKEKEKNNDNFYLNNFRYGLRLQLGFRSTDLFFNYDMNDLFISGKGPALNAFSFGVTL